MRPGMFQASATVCRLGLSVGIACALATPVLAQGKGKRPPRCVDDVFPATLRFVGHPDDMIGPTILPSMGGDHLLATLTNGNIASGVEGAYADGQVIPNDDLPVHLDLSLVANHYDEDEVDIDPFVSTLVHTDDASLEVVDCQMFGMVVGESYRMRLTLQWSELEGEPVPREAASDQRWVLRYKPVDSGGVPEEQLTWLDAVRTANNTWVLTSRTDSDPPHFASLEKDGTTRGKDKQPATYSKPVMPLQLEIVVDCGGPCPEP